MGLLWAQREAITAGSFRAGRMWKPQFVKRFRFHHLMTQFLPKFFDLKNHLAENFSRLVKMKQLC